MSVYLVIILLYLAFLFWNNFWKQVRIDSYRDISFDFDDAVHLTKTFEHPETGRQDQRFRFRKLPSEVGHEVLRAVIATHLLTILACIDEN